MPNKAIVVGSGTDDGTITVASTKGVKVSPITAGEFVLVQAYTYAVRDK